eukprot:ANDGO_03505.mRNA.1 CTP synthase
MDGAGGVSERSMIRYILVTGGVISGIGKGVTTSSIGAVLKTCGCAVTAIKIDPYLNIDAGLMSPFEHGEAFVLEDGSECDLDLGNYERYLDVNLTRQHNITTGKIYSSILEKERKGEFLGKTVQVIPHVVNEIIQWIESTAACAFACDPVVLNETPEHPVPKIVMIELGGVISDIESAAFIEALRQLRHRVTPRRFACVQVSLVPVISGQQKTKPTQHSVRESRAAGLQPDLIAARCQVPLSEESIQKIALHCQVSPNHVISLPDVSNLYQVPLLLEKQGVVNVIKEQFGLEFDSAIFEKNMGKWRDLASREDNLDGEVRIALVGKYTDDKDAYLSVAKALEHAGNQLQKRVGIDWIDAEKLEEQDRDAWRKLRSADGVLIPGGFSARGVEGKILAARWARQSRTPFLGVCLGMQCAVIDWARDVLHLDGANSEEFEKTAKHRVLIYMPDVSREVLGGTMRLGSHKILIKQSDPPCLLSHVYGNASEATERYRHRYEVNPDLVKMFEDSSMLFTGRDESGVRMSAMELPRSLHPFFLGLQSHPEFKSRPGKPSPPFFAFVEACVKGPSNA